VYVYLSLPILPSTGTKGVEEGEAVALACREYKSGKGNLLFTLPSSTSSVNKRRNNVTYKFI
jgi:hypothetical protein